MPYHEKKNPRPLISKIRLQSNSKAREFEILVSSDLKCLLLKMVTQLQL